MQPDNANVRWWEGLEGNFSSSIYVGGVPVPVGGGAKPEGDAGIPNPEMLRCQAFSIETNEHGLLLTYQGVGEEKLRPGAYRGLHSAWSGRKLTSNYESTTRKVKRTLGDPEGRPAAHDRDHRSEKGQDPPFQTRIRPFRLIPGVLLAACQGFPPRPPRGGNS